MKRPIASWIILITVAGCSEEHQYRSAVEFTSDIDKLAVVGMSAQSVQTVFQGKGFSCSQTSDSQMVCQKHVQGFPCAQDQHLSFTIRGGVVVGFSVKRGSDEQELPSVCL